MKLRTALTLALFVPLAGVAAEGSGANAEHGRYLVHGVAMCVQCHSPRDERGALVPTQLLAGAPVPVTSPFRNLTFATAAPKIAGLPGYTEKEGIRLVTEGLARDRRTPRPPMPPFRMTAEDARDVVSYLRSLDTRP